MGKLDTNIWPCTNHNSEHENMGHGRICNGLKVSRRWCLFLPSRNSWWPLFTMGQSETAFSFLSLHFLCLCPKNKSEHFLCFVLRKELFCLNKKCHRFLVFDTGIGETAVWMTLLVIYDWQADTVLSGWFLFNFDCSQVCQNQP